MEKIRFMADSASDISQEFAKEMGVSIIPVNVSIGDEQFKDGVTIDSDTFFQRLVDEDVIPKTSQPSPDDYIAEFRKYEDHTDIICVCLTSKGSGTYNCANLAKQIIKEEGFAPNIHIVDSLNASIAILETVKLGKKMADDGSTVSQILAKLEEIKDKMSIYFVVDTLEYIRKGGRIGNVKAMLGTVLKIKPILTFIKGYAQDVDKVRGIEQARRKLISFFEEKAQSFSEVTVVHAFNKEQAKLLEKEIKAKFEDIKISLYQVGTSIGTYTGPGAFGLVFMEKAPRW